MSSGSKDFSQMIGKDEDGEDEDYDDGEVRVDHVKQPDKSLEEDTFGMVACSVVRDLHSLGTMDPGTPGNVKCARGVRIATTMLLLAFTLFLQIFLLENVKKFVSAKAVHDVRGAYDLYQGATYNCTEVETDPTFTHCFKNKYGSWRGKKEFFNLELARQRLAAMPEGDQGNACRISLSQPEFLYFVLLIWTITCLYEIRKTLDLQCDICFIETVASMDESLRVEDGSDSDGDQVTTGGTIIGLTCFIKCVLTLFMLVRLVVTVVLLYLGCRWLLATNRFADLILNAMALEFILCLKELMYAALMPARNKIDMSNTSIVPAIKKIAPDICSFAGSMIFLVFAAIWVWLYMWYIQEVLPDYNWDIGVVCSEWIKKRFCVSTDCISAGARRLLRGGD